MRGSSVTTERRVAEPGRELLGDAIGDLGVARDPDDAATGRDRDRGGERGLRAVRHRGVGDVAKVAPDTTVGGAGEAVGERGDLA